MAVERSIRVLEYNSIREKLAQFAKTSPGKKLCLELEPSNSQLIIQRNQDDTAQALAAIEEKSSPDFFGLKDYSEVFARLRMKGVLQQETLLEIADFLRACKGMKEYFSEGDDYPRLTDRVDRIISLIGVQEEIFRVVISSNEIADDATPKLERIRKSINRKEGQIRDKLQSYIRSPEYQKKLRENIITIREGRYVLPVRNDAKSSFPGIVHDRSSSGQTLFIEPMSIVEMNNEIRELYTEEEAEIHRILKELSGLLSDYVDEIEENLEIMKELDFIFAKAYYAMDLEAVRPIIKEEGFIDLKQARHPLIDPDDVIPIDIELGNEYTTLVITGPNTGGKTVSLKTLGLCSLMAQSGLHIPTEIDPKLPVFDAIYSDIGDEQSIQQSLSTFSSHMSNIVEILSSYTDNSLILLDELGAGTDPVEGAALAMSILEDLLKNKVLTAATTHYSQLKLFALNTKGVQNASMEFDLESLRPTYRLLIGMPGKSNAFEISSRLGLPKYLIEEAKRKVSDESLAFEDVLETLEKEQQIAEKERKKLNLHREVWQEKEKAIDKEIEKISELKAEEIEKGRKEAEKLILEAKKEVEEIISGLKDSKAYSSSIDRAKQELRDIERKYEKEKEDSLIMKSSNIPKNLKLGEKVRILSMNGNGEVMTLPDGNGELTVQMGILRVNVSIDEIERIAVDKEEKSKVITKSVLKSRGMEEINTQLDLRGLRVEEAIQKTEYFLDNCLLANVSRAEIIHGKGTGQLRVAITNYLKDNPQIKSFRLGTPAEGGDGITIIKM